jgi:hypothetical protein
MFTDRLKIQLRMGASHRVEQIARHEKIGRVGVGDALWGHPALREGFLHAADERLTLVMGPMSDFMGQGKSLAPVGTIFADRDNCSVVTANNACFAALKLAIPVAPARPKIVSMANVRDRLRRALATCPPDVKLTLAARNENELSDADVLGMLQDLEELGIVAP